MAEASQLKRRLAELKAEKQLHEQSWKDCFDITFPARAHGLNTQILSASDAQQRKATIFDSTPGDACKVGSATLMGSMMPSNLQWFDVDIGKETEEERGYLDEFCKFIWENLHASNFDAEGFDALTDTMVAGWPVLYCDEAEEGGFYFELWPIGECCIGATRRGGRVDTVYREFTLTVAQTVAEYGIDKVSQKVREKYQAKKFDEKVQLLHAIEPRSLYAIGAKMARNLPVASCHIELESEHVLRESGFHEFPCMVPRWSRLPGSSYATGPMSDALADARTLNQMGYLGLLGAETAIAPPMIAEDDGVLNPRNIKMGPRKIIVANSVDSMKELVSRAKVEFAELKAERLQASIRKILLADQLPPADGPVKTAYEWAVRVDQLRKMLGPLFARFQAEFLQALIERVFGITWRANELTGWALAGRPPASLIGRTFSVRYQSPLARAQRMEEVASMDRFEQTLAAEAQIDATVLDVYDIEEAARTRGRLLGISRSLLRDKKRTAEHRELRLEAQAKAQQQAVQQEGQLGMQDAMAKRVANA